MARGSSGEPGPGGNQFVSLSRLPSHRTPTPAEAGEPGPSAATAWTPWIRPEPRLRLRPGRGAGLAEPGLPEEQGKGTAPLGDQSEANTVCRLGPALPRDELAVAFLAPPSSPAPAAERNPPRAGGGGLTLGGRQGSLPARP